MKSARLVYALAAMVSGGAWAGLAYLFERLGTEALPFPALLVCGAMTGLAVSYVFSGAFRNTRSPRELALPLLTLPLAVSLFAVLVWCARVATGHRSHWRPLLPGEELSTIVAAYWFYGLLSPLFTPVLYVFALVNQGIMHLILEAGVEQ